MNPAPPVTSTVVINPVSPRLGRQFAWNTSPPQAAFELERATPLADRAIGQNTRASSPALGVNPGGNRWHPLRAADIDFHGQRAGRCAIRSFVRGKSISAAR